ncbi:MAG: NADPH-dependent glutamate synthase [Candidatus Omnitrophica bacterium]|nr:NADPH-dependent glutamate synthase [Candidatus Omnitrophota bacterium]
MRKDIPKQPAKERIKNFFEVALGFSKEEAEKEASRCLQCKNPLCVKGCPVEIDIPSFIKLIKEGRQKEALAKIKEKNNLPAVCGRVCPQENQCEAACVLNKKKIPINIGALERYAADYELVHGSELKVHNKKFQITGPGPRTKVAVVGSGPAGLTCAADLAKMGYQVTIFESLHLSGGVLIYGIPEFRLPKKIVENEVNYIKSLGVDIKVDNLVGKTYSIEELLQQGFKAMFIAVGAGLPQFLGIPGENLDRVYSANEFLTRINLMKAYKFPEYATPISIGKKVAVIGGGNVALDSARVARRLGRQVSLVYRRTEKEMPGRIEEVENALAEGIIFEFLTQPVRILADNNGFVKALECIKMSLGEPDSSGRRRPVPVKDSNFTLDVDTVIIAIGQNPNPLLPKLTPGLKTSKEGTIIVNENFMTSLPGVFAGGDIITGADTVISAMGAGKKAAVAIDKYIKGAKNGE